MSERKRPPASLARIIGSRIVLLRFWPWSSSVVVLADSYFDDPKLASLIVASEQRPSRGREHRPKA